jgi:hypothetical protein
MTTDLSDVTEGDRLILRHHRYTTTDLLSIVTVERTTATQILVDGVRYWRETGGERGGGLHPDTLELPTPETLKLAKCQLYKQHLLHKIEGVDWAGVDSRAVLQVYAVLRSWGVLGENGCTK